MATKVAPPQINYIERKIQGRVVKYATSSEILRACRSRNLPHQSQAQIQTQIQTQDQAIKTQQPQTKQAPMTQLKPHLKVPPKSQAKSQAKTMSKEIGASKTATEVAGSPPDREVSLAKLKGFDAVKSEPTTDKSSKPETSDEVDTAALYQVRPMTRLAAPVPVDSLPISKEKKKP